MGPQLSVLLQQFGATTPGVTSQRLFALIIIIRNLSIASRSFLMNSSDLQSHEYLANRDMDNLIASTVSAYGLAPSDISQSQLTYVKGQCSRNN